MATIRERNGTYQITVYSGFDLNGRRKRETTTFTPQKNSPRRKRKRLSRHLPSSLRTA